jgi:hypothetical protein
VFQLERFSTPGQAKIVNVRELTDVKTVRLALAWRAKNLHVSTTIIESSELSKSLGILVPGYPSGNYRRCEPIFALKE